MSDTREILIDTAADLFLGKGYGVVGTSEICRTAGVNKGTFYHFFPSKTDLLLATIERYAEHFRDEFIRISGSIIQPPQKLEALFAVPAKINQDWKEKHGFAQGCLVGNMALELGSVDETVRKSVLTAIASWRDAIVPIIEELTQTGHLPPTDPQKAAETVIAMIQGGLVIAKTQNDPSQVSSLAPAALGALQALTERNRRSDNST